MPLILGLDPSKCTGWALYDTTKLTPKFWGNAFDCGVFELPKNADVYHTADMVGAALADLIIRCQKAHDRKPDFAIIEGQIEASVAGTGFSAFYPWIACSSLVALLGRYRIPYATLMPATWRVGFFGQGYKPPFKVIKLKKPDAKGKTERIEWLWKDAAVDRCKELGIELPKSKAHADDAAEACALAYCWQSDKLQFHSKRYHQPWIDIRINDNSTSRGAA